ncbi:hypothetical protein LCGC14_2575050 [marine sediment metagenome]|uniref:Uncharacterized protein n=1 Tax=marine sediment metagenome TaxID=412755 RepID=A0A0F9B403_9ZZZZ
MKDETETETTDGLTEKQRRFLEKIVKVDMSTSATPKNARNAMRLFRVIASMNKTMTLDGVAEILIEYGIKKPGGGTNWSGKYIAYYRQRVRRLASMGEGIFS